MLPSIRNVQELEGKIVLTRVDFNVPLENGELSAGGDWRLKAVLPTLNYLAQKGAKIVLLSHLGRPQGRDLRFSLYPVFERLKKLWPEGGLSFSAEVLGREAESKISKLKNGRALLLENLRFYKEEEKNDDNFSSELSKLGDFFVNDAFAASHRAHASIVGITRHLESFAGLLLEKEVAILSLVKERTRRPLIFILGGAKAETKLKFIGNFLNKSEWVLVGGVLANTLLYARGKNIGRSVFEEGLVEEAKKLGMVPNSKLLLPADATVSEALNVPINVSDKSVDKIALDDFIVDIGAETISLFARALRGARMIVWNGSLGVSEIADFRKNSIGLAKIIAKSQAEKVVGGGDLINFLSREGLIDKMSYVSTGGGAMLEFLAGEGLPGITTLQS